MTEMWEYDRLISRAMNAIAKICDDIDRGESFESVAKRVGLSKHKVEKVYRARNKKLKAAVQEIYDTALTPMNASSAKKPRASVRKNAPGAGLGTRNKRRYIDDLIKEIKSEQRP